MWLSAMKFSFIFYMMHAYIFFAFIFNLYLLLSDAASVRHKPYKNKTFLTRTWNEAIALATELTAKMTLDEKCNMTAGVAGQCAGFVSPIAHLNFAGLCFQDSPSGVGDGVQFSTAFIAGIQIGATWDRDLFYQRAVAIGQEF